MSPPNRLQRVKLSAHDLIRELRGDRIGLIAFAGRAFLQAPLTIDYDAAAEALNDLDTNIIPEGGTNISEAINLAVKTFGKSAIGNRALIIFTDGEELAGEATKAAQSASDAGVRIFTVGVGTPEGSLIPLQARAATAFVKDSSGQVVKSKLDESRLREIAQITRRDVSPARQRPGDDAAALRRRSRANAGRRDRHEDVAPADRALPMAARRRDSRADRVGADQRSAQNAVAAVMPRGSQSRQNGRLAAARSGARFSSSSASRCSLPPHRASKL